jgi:hypothetical protein
MLVALVMSHAPLLSMVAVVRPSLPCSEACQNRIATVPLPSPFTLQYIPLPPSTPASSPRLSTGARNLATTPCPRLPHLPQPHPLSPPFSTKKEKKKNPRPRSSARRSCTRERGDRVRTVSRVCILLPTHGVVGLCVREVMCVG